MYQKLDQVSKKGQIKHLKQTQKKGKTGPKEIRNDEKSAKIISFTQSAV